MMLIQHLQSCPRKYCLLSTVHVLGSVRTSTGCPALLLPPALRQLTAQLLQVRKLLQHERTLLHKYEEKLLDSYIEDNKSVRWCPSVPHCGCAIQVGSGCQLYMNTLLLSHHQAIHECVQYCLQMASWTQASCRHMLSHPTPLLHQQSQTSNLVIMQHTMFCTQHLMPNPGTTTVCYQEWERKPFMLVIQVDGDLQCEPVCQCGLKFCFQCGLDPHSPCTCEM